MRLSWMIFVLFCSGCSVTTSIKIGGDGIVSPGFVAKKINIEIESDIRQSKLVSGQKY